MAKVGGFVAAAVTLCGMVTHGQEPKPAGQGEPGKAPAPFTWRSGEAREKLLLEAGGTADTQRAVERGLEWLAKQQRKDGAWVHDGMSKEDTISATAMGLLPFLGTGYTHKDGKHQKTVYAGLKHLVTNMDKNGRFATKSTSYMYTHGLATLALCEAYAMTKDPALRRHAQLAVAYLQKGQGTDGSWGYQPNTDGDTSIVGWQVQALTAARLAGDLGVDERVLKRASAFLDKAGTGPQRAMYGYRPGIPGAPGTALTAIGLISRTALDGWAPDNPAIAEGVQGMMKRPIAPNRIPDMYHYYYATRLLRYAGGPEWQTWNEGPEKDGKRQGGMRNLLVSLQVTQGGDAGSWDKDFSFVGSHCGRHGTTCLCLLTLEVYYRYPSAAKPRVKE